MTINSMGVSDSTLETSKPETFSDSEPQKILGWHFSEDTKLSYDDNRPIVVGEMLSVIGEIIPCKFGLHASEKALDAFQYIQGNYLWRVELEGDLQSHANSKGIMDKWVGRKRKVLAGGDATEMLKKFARDCTLEVIHLCPNVPEEVKTFLKTGVITEIVENYYKYYSYNSSAYDDAYYSYYAAFYAYYVYKNYGITYVRNIICHTANALNVSFETYTNKFEEACLKFIKEKC